MGTCLRPSAQEKSLSKKVAFKVSLQKYLPGEGQLHGKHVGSKGYTISPNSDHISET